MIVFSIGFAVRKGGGWHTAMFLPRKLHSASQHQVGLWSVILGLESESHTSLSQLSPVSLC